MFDFSTLVFPRGFLLQPLTFCMVCLTWLCRRQILSQPLLCIQFT